MKALSRALFICSALLAAACSSASKGQVKGIREGMTKSGVIIESGRPVENWGRDGKDYWSYANDSGERCKVRFENGRVSKDEIKCEPAAPDRAPAYIEAAQKYQLRDKEETREQRIRRFCGEKPEPRLGCKITECVDGMWQEVCGGQPLVPEPK